MKEILLTQGKVALVDDEDFDLVNQHSWHYNAKKGYAVTAVRVTPTKQKAVYMHRLIMNTPTGMVTDHKDHDTLNNQKSNLRVCTSTENNRNKGLRKNKTSSKFKGVTIKIDSKYGYKFWCATITINKKKTTKAFPFTPEGELMAKEFYDNLAKKHFGEFALLN